MRVTKEQKGITLIALVITIIVLLILAGVALATLTGNGSIIDNANYAVEEYSKSANADQNVITGVENLFARYMGTPAAGDDDDTPTSTPAQTYTITYNANGGTGTMGTETASTTATSTFTAPLGNGFKEWNTQADGSGTSYAPGATISSDITLYAIWGGTYKLGEEVTINVVKGEETVAESFYVLKDDNTNPTGNVTLLAKYNLDKNTYSTTGKYYQKPNAAYLDTECNFATTRYWVGEEESVYTDMDTNDEETYGAAQPGSALDRAKSYATNTIDTNAIGRLLNTQEAWALYELEDKYGDMLYGKANQQGENSEDYYLSYWLSNANDNSYDGAVEIVDGEQDSIWWEQFEYSGRTGVRPVITVSKTLIAH